MNNEPHMYRRTVSGGALGRSPARHGQGQGTTGTVRPQLRRGSKTRPRSPSPLGLRWCFCVRIWDVRAHAHSTRLLASWRGVRAGPIACAHRPRPSGKQWNGSCRIWAPMMFERRKADRKYNDEKKLTGHHDVFYCGKRARVRAPHFFTYSCSGCASRAAASAARAPAAATRGRCAGDEVKLSKK